MPSQRQLNYECVSMYFLILLYVKEIWTWQLDVIEAEVM